MMVVSVVDRKDLTAYLRGEVDTSDNIELVAPPVRRGTEVAAKRPREGGEAGGDGEAEHEPPKLVVSRKRPILDRNSGLFTPSKARRGDDSSVLSSPLQPCVSLISDPGRLVGCPLAVRSALALSAT